MDQIVTALRQQRRDDERGRHCRNGCSENASGHERKRQLSLPSIIECWPQKIGEALIKINA
jgi:hypothetical protein